MKAFRLIGIEKLKEVLENGETPHPNKREYAHWGNEKEKLHFFQTEDEAVDYIDTFEGYWESQLPNQDPIAVLIEFEVSNCNQDQSDTSFGTTGCSMFFTTDLGPFTIEEWYVVNEWGRSDGEELEKRLGYISSILETI